MRRNIEKLLSKDEMRRLSKKDAEKTKDIDSDSVHIDSEDEISEKESLLYRYGVFGSNVDKKKSDDKRVKKPVSIDDEFVPEPSQKEDIPAIDQGPNLDYTAVKDDIARLASYEELAKQYQLTPEQNETVGEIYGRLKEAEEEAAKLGNQYQQMSDKVKEIADVSKRMMEEISGNYVKDISEYRHTP